LHLQVRRSKPRGENDVLYIEGSIGMGSEQSIGDMWPRKGRFPLSAYIISPADGDNRFLIMLLHV
jgi:hypothetical protein